MRKTSNRITGTIRQGKMNVTFFCENHHFTFVRVDDAPLPFVNEIIKAQDGFIEGKTSDEKKILIFTKGDMNIAKTRELYTWLYIIATNKAQALCEYDGIRFENGALKSLFYRSSLNNSIPLEKDLEIKDDSIKIDVNSDGIEKMIIRSVVSGCDSMREGVRIDNSQITLEMFFAQKISINNSFQDKYNTILELCRFLTYRKYASFESVRLLSKENHSDIPVVIGDCYIRGESEYEVNRDPIRCITFNEIYPYFNKLYLIIRNRYNKNSKYYVDFIPESPKEFNRVSPELIRRVCASADFETHICKTPVKKNTRYINVKKKIKEVIDQSKDSEEPLTDKEYSYLESSFRYLDGPLEERMINLYEQYKDCIEKIIEYYDIKKITEEEIHKMIVVRNGMSHGTAITSIDVEAYTTKAFIGIIYASILSRCKCSHKEIKQWIDDGLLTSNDT